MTDDVRTCSAIAPKADDGSAREFDPAWRSETVHLLVKGIVAKNAYDHMHILADALEEAGCDDEELLRHCRECERHGQNCWVLHAITSAVPLTYIQSHKNKWQEKHFTSGGTAKHAKKLANVGLETMHVLSIVRWVCGIIFVLICLVIFMCDR